MKGYIPQNVVFFCRNEGTHTSPAGTFQARMAFPVSDQLVARGAKTVENAQHWAAGYHPRPDDSRLKGIEVENTPKDSYRVINAEQRGEGGRAWKVITPEGYLVDLREDVFLPLLLREGLPKSGIIPATFQWCVNGSQIRLERVGSKAHALYTPADEVPQVKAATKAAKTKVVVIPVKDLVVGGVYQFNTFGSNEQRVYLGRARVDGKTKTVWMGVRHNGPPTPQGRFDRMWNEQVKHGWPHPVTLSTGSKALTRLHGHVAMPDGWLNSLERPLVGFATSPAVAWCRGDGIKLGDPDAFEWL